VRYNGKQALLALLLFCLVLPATGQAVPADGEYQLDVLIDGQGSVGLDPDLQTYPLGQQITLTAVPDAGWTFSGWSGDATSEENPLTLSISGNLSLTATFVQEYELVVTLVGVGTVQKEPDLDRYPDGTEVTLTAVPADGWIFAGWGDDLSGEENPTTLAMTDDITVTATFAPPYELVVNLVGAGTVEKEPDQAAYLDGDEVMLTAVPADGWIFAGWGDDLSGEENPTTLTMTGDITVTATFAPPYELVVNLVGEGTVQKEPDQAAYLDGDEVTLTAMPADGWAFGGWSGDLQGAENPTVLTIGEDAEVTATFFRQYELIVNLVGRGAVQKIPDKDAYLDGDEVTLTAEPADGWAFSGWSGDASGDDNPLLVKMTANRKITASFRTIDPGGPSQAFLPLVLESWPPVAGPPSMVGISNSDGDGDYLVRWSPGQWAQTYTLEEDTNPAFVEPRELYRGPRLSYSVTERGAGRYYYRARSHNEYGDSHWSNKVWVDVRWELEPNGEPLDEANGPLVSGLVYYGTFPEGEDAQDYYFFELDRARKVELALGQIARGHNYDLVLEDEALTRLDAAEGLGNGDELIQTDTLPPGRYYIGVINAGRTGSTQAYHLRFVAR
jgi:uncharacterized repeat protein (TIGR02543 family)